MSQVKELLMFVVTPVAVIALSSNASAQISVPGKLIEERRAVAGQTYGGIIGVTNTSGKAQEARVYQTDFTTNSDGTVRFDDPGLVARSNAKWVSVPARIVIPAGQSADISYNVTVPPTATLAGTYWSVVMIEAVPAGSPESSVSARRRTDVQIGLDARFRAAVQIVTHVGPKTPPKATFANPRFQSVGDTMHVLQFELQNTGDAGFRPELTLELYTEDGAHVTTRKAVRGLVYPGLVVRQRFELDRLRPSPTKYRAIVTADLGDGTVVGARYTLGQ